MYYLGTITGSSGSASNHRTGPSGLGTFAIPKTVRSLYLVPGASGVFFELGVATGATTTLGRGAQLQPNQINGPYTCIGEEICVSVYHTQAGSVSIRVYAGPKQ